jgi:hypothetical protein
MVLWGSVALSDSLIRERLVEEYRLQVCPVVLGRGKRLFGHGLGTQCLRHLETNTDDARRIVRRPGRPDTPPVELEKQRRVPDKRKPHEPLPMPAQRNASAGTRH